MAAENQIIDLLQDIAGAQHVITSATYQAPHLTDWRGHYTGTALAVVKPGSTAGSAAFLPSPMNTASPLCRRRQYRALRRDTGSERQGHYPVTGPHEHDPPPRYHEPDHHCEAGCILENIQQAAEAEDLLFPLNFGSRRSCQIGGNLSTNAGGLNVVRYGNTRSLCLGLEVVAADGQVMNLLCR